MKYLVQINYKSGNSVQLWFKSFEFQSSRYGNRSYKWEIDDPKQKILLLGIDDVESIIQLDVKED